MNKESHKLLRLMATAIAAVGMLTTANSQAFLIDSNTNINDTFTINYLLANAATDGNGNTNVTGQDITGTVIFELLGFDTVANEILLGLDVTNTSVNNGVQVGFQKIAFGTDPAATAVVFLDGDDGEFISAKKGADPEVQNAVGGEYLDIQTETGTGAPRLLLEGEMDAFQLDISFAELTDAGATFDPFSSKWQTNLGSYEFPGTPPGGGNPPAGQIPEPGMMALFGIGLMGMGLSRIRRKRKVS